MQGLYMYSTSNKMESVETQSAPRYSKYRIKCGKRAPSGIHDAHRKAPHGRIVIPLYKRYINAYKVT